MTINLAYDSGLSRVQVSLSDLPNGAAIVERSTNQLMWFTVRGAAALPIIGGASAVDDYEFAADVENFYRVTQTNLEENVDVFATSGTWNKPVGMVAARITVVGGGCAGGGAAATAAGECSAGNGGAPGGIAISVIDAATLGASETVTVGTGGTGSAGGNGGSGTGSSFGAHVVVSGGGGGAFFSASANDQIGFGTSPGGATTGQVLVRADPGGQAQAYATLGTARGGIGGGGMFGGGGRGTSGSDGESGFGRGSGGGGAANTPSAATARAGGSGSDGLVIVEPIYAD